MNKYYFIFSDSVWYILIEIFFIGIVVYAFLKHQLHRGSPQVIRGDTSWQYIFMTWIILSLIIVNVISSANILIGYKTFITIINLAFLVYLVFMNSWFRNKIVGFWNWFRHIPEK
jgi:hypothetical protein